MEETGANGSSDTSLLYLYSIVTRAVTLSLTDSRALLLDLLYFFITQDNEVSELANVTLEFQL